VSAQTVDAAGEPRAHSVEAPAPQAEKTTPAPEAAEASPAPRPVATPETSDKAE
jgi:hypothetical protein